MTSSGPVGFDFPIADRPAPKSVISSLNVAARDHSGKQRRLSQGRALDVFLTEPKRREEFAFDVSVVDLIKVKNGCFVPQHDVKGELVMGVSLTSF